MCRFFFFARRDPSLRTNGRSKAARRLTFLRGEELEDRRVLASAYLPPTQFLFSEAGSLTPPSQGAPLDIALAYLDSHASTFGLTTADIEDAVLTDL
jgi:hypothetical protein